MNETYEDRAMVCSPDECMLALAGAARARGRRYVRRSGRPVRLGEPGECWTNAWTLAEAAGFDYCEGIAIFPSGRWVTHAWCLDRKGRVVEPSPDFDDAEYRGFVLPRGFVRAASRTWEGWRSSMLECVYAAGPDDGVHRSRTKFLELTA